MDARQITALDDEAFEELLLAHVHPPVRDPDVWAGLTHPDNIRRTQSVAAAKHQRTAHALRKRKAEREVFQQECLARGYEGKRDWFETRAEYESWRSRAGNFHQTMQKALSEIARIMRDQNRSAGDRSFGAQRNTLRLLALAVSKHQAAHARAGGVAEQQDYELWRVLDQLTVPTGPDQDQVSLRTMLDVYWTEVNPVSDVEERRADAERMMRGAPGGQSSRYAGVPRARHVDNGKGLA
ncbi:hypothetical protein [Streptomyces showdoensis]|nr:hypothetical protein [Streptomyces showdoensis]